MKNKENNSMPNQFFVRHALAKTAEENKEVPLKKQG